MITLIAAVGKNNVIGGDNRLLWRQRSDLAFFKAQTLHKSIIMGRKTFESLGKALPNRLNIVVSKQQIMYKNAIVTHTLDDALSIAGALNRDINIIGGEQVYSAYIHIADRLLITEIDTAPQGDAFFPAINPNSWRVKKETPLAKQEGDEFDMIFKEYERTY